MKNKNKGHHEREEKKGKNSLRKRNGRRMIQTLVTWTRKPIFVYQQKIESSCSKVSNSNIYSELNKYDELLCVFQELYAKSEKLNYAQRKLKLKYKSYKRTLRNLWEKQKL